MNHRTINKRYILQERLGAGGMGEVYQAYDRLTDKTVALKRVLLTEDKLEIGSQSTPEDARVALAHEFKILASLRHPNIINVLDYGFDDEGQPFFTMAHIDGAVAFSEVIRDNDATTKIEYIIQVLQGLAYMHQRGLLHRDLKTANLLLNEDQVKIIDFGLALEANQSYELAGTVTNLAPEILSGHPPSPASDLYAVGLIIYHAFTQQLPFKPTGTLTEIVQSILTMEPDLSLLPHNIAQVVGRLLEKEPAWRYANAYETIIALCAAIQRPIPPETEDIRESYLQAANFVGRHDELHTLKGALVDLRKQSKGSAWLIGGESGVGKSRLIEELRIHALVSGIRTVEGFTIEAGPPFQLWRTVLPQLILSADVPASDIPVLQTLIPHIHQLLGISPPEHETVSVDSQARIINAIINLLQHQQQPLLLILEDLHWVRDSLIPLQQLVALLDELPLVVIGSYRHDEMPNLPAKLPQMTVMPLQRLSREDIDKLSQSMVGQAKNREELVHLLDRETEGNVFFVVEIMRALAEEAGRLHQIDQVKLPETIITGGIQHVLERRLERVRADDRPLLQRAAVAGRNLNKFVLNQLSNGVSVDEWLMRCGELAVLEVYENQWRFAHDKLRRAILERIAADHLTTYHRDIATALETVYPGDPTYAAQLAEHWLAAESVDKAMPYAIEYLQQLNTVSAFAEVQSRAKEWLQRVGACDDPEYCEMKLKLIAADAEEKLGNYHTAGMMYEKALLLARQQDSQVDIVSALLGLGLTAYWRGQFERARNFTEEALSRTEKGTDARRQAHALRQMGWILCAEGDVETGIEHLNLSLSSYLGLNDQRQAAGVLHDLGENFIASGQYENALAVLQESLEIARQLADRRWMATAKTTMAKLLFYRGDFDTAYRYYEESLQAFRQMQYQHAIGSVLIGLGMIETERGNLEDAMQYYQESSIIFRQTGNRVGLAGLLVELAATLRRQGQYQYARQYLQESRQMMSEIGDQEPIPYTVYGLGVIALDERDFPQAYQQLNQALGFFRDTHDRYGETHALYKLGQLAYAQDDMETALETYQIGLEVTRRDNIHLAEVKILIGMAFAHIAQGNIEIAHTSLLEGLQAAFEMAAVPLQLQALIGLGYVAFTRRDFKEAARLACVVSVHSLFNDILDKLYLSPLLKEVYRELTPIEINIILQRAKSARFDAVVQDLLDSK